MELIIDDPRIDWLPRYYRDCPNYWKKFLDTEVYTCSDSWRTVLYQNYNVEYVGYDTDIIYTTPYKKQIVSKVVFKTVEDLVYFKLRWS